MPEQSFGQRLTQLRQTTGWTMYRLAHESGVNEAHVGKLERDERVPTLSTLQRLAKALGVSLAEFDNVSVRAPR